jgi:hypothetical protein
MTLLRSAISPANDGAENMRQWVSTYSSSACNDRLRASVAREPRLLGRIEVSGQAFLGPERAVVE